MKLPGPPTPTIRRVLCPWSAVIATASLLLAGVFSASAAGALQSRQASGGPAWLATLPTADPGDSLIPQRLLPLAHAAEIQAELALAGDQVERLERLFGELDGEWFRSRNLGEDESRQVVAGLEQRLLKGLRSWLPEGQLVRLRQLELQAQSARALLRPAVADQLGINSRQLEQLRQLASETDRIAREVAAASQKGTADPQAAERLKQATAAENSGALQVLSSDQRTRLASTLGNPLDLNSLQRVYPMAPELVDTDGWIGPPPGSLSDLRGKVVIVHFYAFQCINCRRNLPRYNEWRDEFPPEEVAIIGVQTPELAPERDAGQVRTAAESEKIRYPVLLDLQSKNWEAWGTTMWPTVYVIDRDGYIRMWWQGELNWQGATGDRQIADAVRRLLAK